MKKRISLKNHSKKRKINYKIFFFIFVFIFFLSITFNYLLSKNININSKILVNYLLQDSSPYIKQTKLQKKKISVINLLNLNYYAFKEIKNKKEKKLVNQKLEVKKGEPLIYLYNSHQTEEYSNSDMPYDINPTVTINNYIMKEVFEKNNYKTIIEERSIRDILNINNWNYASSYKASRIYLEDVKKNYPSLKYFIDIHRDSLKKDRTSITINEKKYAKMLFLIGLEHDNYQANLTFTEQINNKVNELYPGLSKGIYKKEGPGVNGIYNQDFSPNTILIEIGGQENTVEEVMNTSLAISNIISEVIKTNEG